MNAKIHRQLNRRKRRIRRRIENKPGVERPEPLMAASRPLLKSLSRRGRADAYT